MHRKQTNQRQILDSQIIYDGALCENIMQEVISYWQSSTNLNDAGIVELPPFAITSVSMITLEAPGRTEAQRTQVFQMLVLFSRCEEYNLLLPLLRNGCSFIDPFVFWRFYKVLFESIALFWKYRIFSNKRRNSNKCRLLINAAPWVSTLK